MKILFWYLKPPLRNLKLSLFFFLFILYAVKSNNMGDRKKRKIVEFLISQKWFELSKPNFHQLLTFILTCFVQKKKIKNGLSTKNLQNIKWAWQTQCFSHTPVILKKYIAFEDKHMLLPSFFWYLLWFESTDKSQKLHRPDLEQTQPLTPSP